MLVSENAKKNKIYSFSVLKILWGNQKVIQINVIQSGRHIKMCISDTAMSDQEWLRTAKLGFRGVRLHLSSRIWHHHRPSRIIFSPGWCDSVGSPPMHQNVAGLISSHGTCPGRGWAGGSWCPALTFIYVSFSKILFKIWKKNHF